MTGDLPGAGSDRPSCARFVRRSAERAWLQACAAQRRRVPRHEAAADNAPRRPRAESPEAETRKHGAAVTPLARHGHTEVLQQEQCASTVLSMLRFKCHCGWRQRSALLAQFHDIPWQFNWLHTPSAGFKIPGGG
jgi:hypothetical protein